MTDKFRVFFAIDIEPEARAEVVKLIKHLQQQKEFSNIKWTKAENLHITLRFLGDINVEQYEKILMQVAAAVKDIQPITITLTDLIVFPAAQNPIALALKPEPIAALVALNRSIEAGIIDCNIQCEPMPFVPHLTLGKVTNKKLQLPAIKLPQIKWTVKAIKLFRSDADTDGSNYKPLICLSLFKQPVF